MWTNIEALLIVQGNQHSHESGEFSLAFMFVIIWRVSDGCDGPHRVRDLPAPVNTSPLTRHSSSASPQGAATEQLSLMTLHSPMPLGNLRTPSVYNIFLNIKYLRLLIFNLERKKRKEILWRSYF